MRNFYELQKIHLPPCVYCGEPATTKDHVPPRCLSRFSQKTVRACFHCNCVILRNLPIATEDERRRYVAEWWERRYAREQKT